MIYLSRHIYRHHWRNSSLFKALADETRLQILGLLAGGVCVCHIHESLRIRSPRRGIWRTFGVRVWWNRRKDRGYYRLSDNRDPMHQAFAGRSSRAGHVDAVHRDAVRLQKRTGCCVPPAQALASRPAVHEPGAERND